MTDNQKNVLETELLPCGLDPITGFYRDGYCNTGSVDIGTHTVCALMTDEFLLFSQSKGNDLITPRPDYGFKGLKAGDYWCLCSLRWEEARQAGCAPRIKLTSTNIKTLELIKLETLKEYQLDLN
ncbi:MAG: DUF2237 domain-containing protein [Pseudomonadota bacterium]|nr:DUF2237 domain-containing protein [Pseudomonadota bacterium]